MTAATGAPVRVCYFNRSYWPDTGATGQLLTELAEDLVAKHGMRGHGGRRLSRRRRPAPSPRPRRATASASSARAAPRCRRAASPGAPLNYLTYFFSALWTGAAAAATGRHGGADRSADHRPRGAGGAAAARHGVFLPGHLSGSRRAARGLPEPDCINALLERLNRFLVRRAARIVALGDTMASRLVDGKGADPAKITVIHNWADTSAIVPSAEGQRVRRARTVSSRRFVVLARRQHRAVAESRRGDRRRRAPEATRPTS